MDSKEDIKKEIDKIETEMKSPTFWNDSEIAQETLKRYRGLKESLNDGLDKLSAIITIIPGAGGDDAEDFCKMLFDMYKKYTDKKDIPLIVIDEHKNEKGGYKEVIFELSGKTYNLFKNESGVHRLVRISPFNAKKQRHTSFALVDVIPKLPPVKNIELKDDDLDIDFTNSGGPGGQNVNKRETAVRITHKPTSISVRVESERSQAQNKERAFEIIRGKLFNLMKKERVEKIQDLSNRKDGAIEWGNQIRSYVLHPYQLVKDLRVDYEERNVEKVLDGEIDGFIEALKDK